MRIAVIDGQGGGMGKTLVEKLRDEFKDSIEIIAIGTNSLATSAMMKAGANEGATGENAIIYNSSRVDLIIGPIGIITANSMLGELTPAMAAAIAESPAKKVLIPVSKCNISIAGVKNEPLQSYIEAAVKLVKNILFPGKCD
ncbi:MAG: DUF3842 family protein [Bacillota bacterium]